MLPTDGNYTHSTVDRGANAGVAGQEMRHYSPERYVDVEGFDHHLTTRLRLGTHGAVGRTSKGDAILVFHNYASHATSPSIHSSLQLEDNGIIVNDRPTRLGGSQSLHSPSGSVIPLTFHDGLACLSLRPYTDAESDTLPRIVMTNEAPWSPHRYDGPAPEISPGTSLAARRLRYGFLHHDTAQATSTSCIHSCEDDILKVIQYEQDTLQVKKWDGSDISVCDDVNSDRVGYELAELENFPPEDHGQLHSLLVMKYVGPWDFSSDNAGWSNRERDCELFIEATLVDPSIAWELKNIFLVLFEDALALLLVTDRRPPTTQLHRAIPPDTDLLDILNTYITDRRSGIYKDFKTTAGERYNTECTALWEKLRLDAMHTAIDHARARIKTALQDETRRLRTSTSIEELEAEMRMLRKQNEARDREIMKRKERIRELEAERTRELEATPYDYFKDAMHEPTTGIDGENDGEGYGIGRNDNEMYLCMLRLTPRISKINVHSPLRLSKLDNIRGYLATDGREWERQEFFSRDRLARYLKVCPWDFVAGWSGKDRTAEVGLEANLYDPDIRWRTKNSYFSLYSTLIGNTLKQGRRDHPRMAHWIPPNHYDSGIEYSEIMRRYVEDSKKGIFDEYKRNIKDTYIKECKVFWRDIEKRYEAELSASTASLAEMLANHDTKKRKRPTEDGDMKPASKP